MPSYSCSTRPLFARLTAACAVFCILLTFPAFAEVPNTPVVYVAQDGVGEGAYGNGKLSVLSDDPNAPVRDIDSYINAPRISADAAGNIYVVSYHTGTVTRYPPGGGGGTVLKRGLLGPRDIVIDRAGGMYIAEDANQTLSYFPPGGAQPVVVASKRVGRLALDSSDNLYFSAIEERALYKRSAATGLVQVLVEGVRELTGLAVDGTSVYFTAADTEKGTGAGIYRYSPTGEYSRMIGGSSAGWLAVDAMGALYFTWGNDVYRRVANEAGVKFSRLASGLIYPSDLLVTSRQGLPPTPLRITSPRPGGGAHVTTQRPTISGTGAPGAAVTVSLSVAPASGNVPIGTIICNALVNDYGNWSCESTVDLAPGNTFGFLAFAWIDGQPSTAQASVFIER